MPRLAEVLKKKPDINGTVSKLIAEKYSAQIDQKTAESSSALAKRINDVFAQLWNRCLNLVNSETAKLRAEFKAEIARIPVPEKVIERVIEKVEKAEEAKEEKEKPEKILVKREKGTGLITKVIKGDETYTYRRNKSGFVTEIVCDSDNRRSG